MREVVWSIDALEDLDGILAHIAADNLSAALGVIDKIDNCGTRLGQMATGRQGRVSGIYEKVVSGLPYILAYAIDPLPDGTERIVILRIIHGARNWLEGTWPES